MAKVYFSISDEMLKRLDRIAEMYGVSRSAYIALLVGQSVAAIEKTFDSIQTTVNNVTTSEEK